MEAPKKKIQMVKVQKLYDSLGIRFPKRLVEDLKLEAGDYLILEWDSETIVARKFKAVEESE